MSDFFRGPSPFVALPQNRFRVILADPPWLFKNRSEKGHAKNPVSQYSCMGLDEIQALPVMELANLDACALLMWATAPMMPHALDTMKCWGFKYSSMGTWAKQSSTGRKWACGTGYRFRSAAEFYILGTIGKPPQRSRSVRNLIVAPVREHSRKPDEIYQMAEDMFDGPYVELFARQQMTGWDCWGLEAGKFS